MAEPKYTGYVYLCTNLDNAVLAVCPTYESARAFMKETFASLNKPIFFRCMCNEGQPGHEIHNVIVVHEGIERVVGFIEYHGIRPE